jgi:hypothetical protein
MNKMYRNEKSEVIFVRPEFNKVMRRLIPYPVQDGGRCLGCGRPVQSMNTPIGYKIPVWCGREDCEYNPDNGGWPEWATSGEVIYPIGGFTYTVEDHRIDLAELGILSAKIHGRVERVNYPEEEIVQLPTQLSSCNAEEAGVTLWLVSKSPCILAVDLTGYRETQILVWPSLARIQSEDNTIAIRLGRESVAITVFSQGTRGLVFRNDYDGLFVAHLSPLQE